MATPNAQSDNSVPGRTTSQPAVPLGQVAGGEKTATADNELKKPIPIPERPVPRTSFAASAAASPRITAPAPTSSAAPIKIGPSSTSAADSSDAADKVAKNEPKTPLDWGLSKKKPRQGRKLKIAAALLLLGALGGGYAAYTQWFATGDDATKEGDQVAQSAPANDAELDSPDADIPDDGDPFDDAPAIRPKRKSRSEGNTEPRRIEIASDATPINPRQAPAGRPRNNPLRDSLALDEDELPEIADSAGGRAAEQSEPDPGDDASGFSIGKPADTSRRRALAGRADSHNQPGLEQQRRSSSGPRLSDAEDTDAGLIDDLADDRLDGYRVADRRGSENSRGRLGKPSISIVEAHDDTEADAKLDGFVPEEMTTHRAVSKTVVVRANDARHSATDAYGAKAVARRDAATRSAAFGDEAEFDEAPVAPGIDANSTYSKPKRGGNNSNPRRATPPAPAADERLMSMPASPGSQSHISGPVSDTYRVAPDDNFWKISRKVYGTARYFQALTRHNEERVPDPQKLRPGTQILTPPAAVLEEQYPDLIEKTSPSAAPSNGVSDRTSLRPTFEKPLVDGDGDLADQKSRTDVESAPAGYFYSKTGEPLYRIGHDDTLGSVAQRHLGRASRWHEIYDLNQDVLKSPDNLTLGTVIRLPSDASRVGLAPESDRRR